MNFTNEQINKAKQAKSAEELLQMANAENYPMTAEEAQKIFAELHKQGELSDDELTAVAGGSKNPMAPSGYPSRQSSWTACSSKIDTISQCRDCKHFHYNPNYELFNDCDGYCDW